MVTAAFADWESKNYFGLCKDNKSVITLKITHIVRYFFRSLHTILHLN
jgi:hypothetical protein